VHGKYAKGEEQMAIPTGNIKSVNHLKF